MTEAEEAEVLLTAWIRDFGHAKEPVFIAHLQTLLAELARLRKVAQLSEKSINWSQAWREYHLEARGQ